MKKPGYCVFGLVMALHACQGPVATTIAPPSGNIESATNCTLTLATPLGNTNLPMARMTDGWFETTFWVTTGLRILLVPSLNNGSRFLLWSGHRQSLTHGRQSPGAAPISVGFTATGDAVCTVRINRRHSPAPFSLKPVANLKHGALSAWSRIRHCPTLLTRHPTPG